MAPSAMQGITTNSSRWGQKHIRLSVFNRQSEKTSIQESVFFSMQNIKNLENISVTNGSSAQFVTVYFVQQRTLTMQLLRLRDNFICLV